MVENPPIHVREITTADISLIADYWLLSPPAFLQSMGVDLAKLPSREGLTQMLTAQIQASPVEKKSYALVWEIEGKPAGHSNVNDIVWGQHATMHLHLWQSNSRQKGLGTLLVKKSLPFFFDNLQLQVLYCEPYALNPAPNKTLEKVGFSWEKTYRTIPGSLNFEQDVNRWYMRKEQYLTLISAI